MESAVSSFARQFLAKPVSGLSYRPSREEKPNAAILPFQVKDIGSGALGARRNVSIERFRANC